MGQNRPKFHILLKSHQLKKSTPPPVVAVVTNMSYGCVSFFTKFQSTLLVPVQMASPQRRPTAETGYSSGRFLKLDNKSKTRITFFHFFLMNSSCRTSYVSVSGTPGNPGCTVHGLTQGEVRYLQVQDLNCWLPYSHSADLFCAFWPFVFVSCVAQPGANTL